MIVLFVVCLVVIVRLIFVVRLIVVVVVGFCFIEGFAREQGHLYQVEGHRMLMTFHYLNPVGYRYVPKFTKIFQ